MEPDFHQYIPARHQPDPVVGPGRGGARVVGHHFDLDAPVDPPDLGVADLSADRESVQARGDAFRDGLGHPLATTLDRIGAADDLQFVIAEPVADPGIALRDNPIDQSSGTASLCPLAMITFSRWKREVYG